ncbi:MAG: hypothetical protein K1060chlam2_01574 [Chlamydiae bacterium]|nr:hypothetical protein [Chlamydiota bacterium]
MHIPVSKSDLYYLSPCIGAIVTQVIFAKVNRNIQCLLAGVGTLLPIAMKAEPPTSLFLKVMISLTPGVLIGFIMARSLRGRLSISTIGVIDIFLAETLLAGFFSSLKTEMPKEYLLSKLISYKIVAPRRGKELLRMTRDYYPVLIRDSNARHYFHRCLENYPEDFSTFPEAATILLDALFKVKKLPEIKWPKSE